MSNPWLNFLAVFGGAAVGAALTVFLTNRSHDRHMREQAFLRMRRILWTLLEGHAQWEEWRREITPVTDELGLIKWHSRFPMKRKAKVKESVRDLAAEIERQILLYKYVTEWDPVLSKVAALKRALFGPALDDVAETQ